jgi:hypothetical protein
MDFYLAENYERFEDRIIAANLAEKWITNSYNAGKPNAAGKISNESNRMRVFQGTSLQYFPVEETKPGDIILKDELGFYHRIVEGIEVWQSFRPLPESHIPFLWRNKH